MLHRGNPWELAGSVLGLELSAGRTVCAGLNHPSEVHSEEKGLHSVFFWSAFDGDQFRPES